MSVGRRIISAGLIFVFALAFLIPGLGWPSPASASTTKPTVTTNSASDIEEDEATLNGEISSDGNSDIEEYGFYYGTDSDPADEGTRKKVGSSIDEDDDFKYSLSGLDEDTKYYFVAYAKNDEGTDYGTVKYFTTDEDGNSDVPDVTTNSATDIEDDSATLNAEIEDVGGSDIEEYGFYYGTSTSCSTRIKVGTDELDAGDDFDYELSNLDDDTTYYFKAYAKNDDGIDYGSVKSFTMDEEEDDYDGDKPSVATKTLTTSNDYATLFGVVTDIGDSDIESYGFYYGTSNSLSTKLEVDDDTIDEGEIFSYNLTGLDQGTTYYVRAYATNDEGTSYGSILSFKAKSNTAFIPASPMNPSMLFIGSKHYKIKGEQKTGDVAPYINNSRTYLPIRQVAYALGINDSDISWDSASQTVTLKKNSKIVKLKVNSNKMDNNGSPVTLDSAPEIKDGRTCLPVSQVAQAFGASVKWDAATQSVTIE